MLIHGYRGYPGELVRPAEDLFNVGFDVFVPRLPGNGTSGDDFVRSRGSDWTGLVVNALKDLKKRYKKVNLLGHSMGSAIAAVTGCADGEIGKIVYVSPSFENLQMPLKVRLLLRFLSPFTPRLNARWHPNTRQHLHYENAPCDNDYLGNEYWRYYFTRQLHWYYALAKQGLKAISAHPHNHLVIYPARDKIISEPSVALYMKAVGKNANIVKVENGTHCVFYDIDPLAEQQAVDAVISFALSPPSGNS